MIKKPTFSLIITLIALMLSSCGKESEQGANSATTVRGLNLTGLWRWIGVECYGSTLSSLTAMATLASGSYSSSLTINGNTATSQSINSSGCIMTYSTSIEATLTEGDSSGGYGNLSTGSTNISLSTGSACTFSANLAMGQGTITPSSVSSSYSQNETIPARTLEFLYNPPYLAIPSILQVQGRPSDLCFLIYSRL
jgi:hypothetical protein